MEKTLVLIKPDAVRAKHIGDIIKIYEEKGLEILAMKMLKMKGLLPMLELLMAKPIQTRLLRGLSASFMQPAAVVMPCMPLIHQRMPRERFLFSSMPQRFLTKALYQVK